MNNFKSGPGGQRKRSEFLGGRPQSDANYGTKKSFDRKPQNAGRGDRGGRGGSDRGGSRDGARRDVEMFKTVCSTCKKSCEVPFRPDGSKPVLCSECFGKNRSDDRGGFERRDRSSNDRGKRDFDAPRKEFTPSPDYKALLGQVTALEGKVNEILEILKTAPMKTTSAKVGAEVVDTDAAPAKVRKPKTIPTPKVAKKAAKKVAKKVAKTAAKKAVKKVAKKK